MTPEEIIAADLTQYSYDDVKAMGEWLCGGIAGLKTDRAKVAVWLEALDGKIADFTAAERKLFDRWADGWGIN